MRDPNNPAPAARRQQPTPPTETEPEQQQQSAASGPGAAGADPQREPIYWDYELRVASDPPVTFSLGRYWEPQARITLQHIPLKAGVSFEIVALPIYGDE